MHSQPVAIVTGGSRGIGRGICVALANAGYAVAVNYQGNESAARETLGLFPGGAVGKVCQANIADARDRDRLVDEVLAEWDRIDLLVNNAGITSVGRKDLLEATEDSWDQVMAINLKGPYFLSQRVAKEMIRLAESQAIATYLPTIVNISSVSAYALSMTRGDYCISKAGMTMLTQLYAARLADHGIRVYELRPGVIETDMTAGAHEKYTKLIAEGFSPIRRWGQPEDLGKAVTSLARGDFPFSTGEVINIDGGFHLRIFPR